MITWAQQYVPAASTVVLASTTPIFAFVITWGITRHEPATLLKLAGAVLGLAGTAVIIGLDALGGLGADIFAEIVILLATISLCLRHDLRTAAVRLRPDGGGGGLAAVRRSAAAAGVADHRSPWTLHPTPQALVATLAMGIFSSAFGLMLFYMCLTRLGTLTTNAQGYLAHSDRRRPLGACCSAKPCRPTSRSDCVLVMAGVAAMTIPGDRYRKMDQPAARTVTPLRVRQPRWTLTKGRIDEPRPRRDKSLTFGHISALRS